jgi:hypothetical protein
MILDHFCSDKKASPYRQIVRVQKKGGYTCTSARQLNWLFFVGWLSRWGIKGSIAATENRVPYKYRQSVSCALLQCKDWATTSPHQWMTGANLYICQRGVWHPLLVTLVPSAGSISRCCFLALLKKNVALKKSDTYTISIDSNIRHIVFIILIWLWSLLHYITSWSPTIWIIFDPQKKNP